MSTEEELKWMTNRYSWRYIPFRYQAMVATIVSAFLYYNLFELFFEPPNPGGGVCGTLFRPVLEEGDSKLGWIWDSGTFFTMNESLQCPRTMQGLWWEFLFTFAALAVCGLVMRRAIKRESTAPSDGSAPVNKSPGWKDDPFNSFKQRWWNGSSWSDLNQYRPGMEPREGED